MLTSNDIGKLFATLQAAYGHSWAHKANAVPVWLRMLGGFNFQDVMVAVEKCIQVYPDYPPSLGQFTDLVEYNTPALEGPKESKLRENTELVDRVYSYTKPFSPIKNPKGNPHAIKLPENIAQRQGAEAAEEYENRIASEVTFALYPWLRPQFENRSF